MIEVDNINRLLAKKTDNVLRFYSILLKTQSDYSNLVQLERTNVFTSINRSELETNWTKYKLRCIYETMAINYPLTKPLIIDLYRVITNTHCGARLRRLSPTILNLGKIKNHLNLTEFYKQFYNFRSLLCDFQWCTMIKTLKCWKKNKKICS